MECYKRPQKMPSKTGVPRGEIAAHAFECSVGSGGWLGGWLRTIQGPRRNCYPDPLLARVGSRLERKPGKIRHGSRQY
jgi:hypothetical protein